MLKILKKLRVLSLKFWKNFGWFEILSWTCMNFFGFFWTHLQFIKNKTWKCEIPQNSPFKIHGRKGCYRMSWNSLRIASKNLKKYMVIFHMNIHLHEFFQIFLSNRVLWRKILLIVCFSPCYLNGQNGVSGASTIRYNWTLSPYAIIFIIFFLYTTSMS